MIIPHLNTFIIALFIKIDNDFRWEIYVMECKIVFSDIDGTVLNSNHHVLPSTTKAVKKLLQKDIPFVLVSARMPEAIKTITDEMNVKIPIISYGGALVLDEEKNTLYDKKITAIDTMNMIEKIKSLWADKVVINYYTDNNWYVEDTENKAVKREENITKVKSKQAPFNQLIKDNILPNKLLCMTEPPICEKMEKVLKDMFPELKIMRSSPILLEIMDKSVSKADGIKIMLNHFNLDRKQSIAFGDNYNDVDMLDFVGLGVAMNNAPEGVKKMTNDVTDDNDHDGIYNFLTKMNLVK